MISVSTRAQWREHRDFIILHSRHLSERERTFIAEVDRRLARGEDLRFSDSVRLSSLHADVKRRVSVERIVPS